ncbi:MAG: hypothetical protein R3D51_17930, partial [Hyphomicrobiaceae bacterium]
CCFARLRARGAASSSLVALRCRFTSRMEGCATIGARAGDHELRFRQRHILFALRMPTHIRAVSVAQGGSFETGALTGAVAAGSSLLMDSSGVMGHSGDGNPEYIAERTAVAAVAGGTASVLAGGKFANGAITGAFAQLYNAEAVDEVQQKLQAVADDAIKKIDAAGDAAFSDDQLAAQKTKPWRRAMHRGYNIDAAVRDAIVDDPLLGRLTGRINGGVDLTDPATGYRYEMTTTGQWPTKVAKYGSLNLFHINTSRALSKAANVLSVVGAIIDIITGRQFDTFCQANPSTCYPKRKEIY